MRLKYFLMETAGNACVLIFRRQGFANVLAQDKKWFDKGENATDSSEGWGRNLVLAIMGVLLICYGDGWVGNVVVRLIFTRIMHCQTSPFG